MGTTPLMNRLCLLFLAPQLIQVSVEILAERSSNICFLNDHARYIAPLFLFIDLLKVLEWSMFLKPNSHEGQKSYETYAPQMAL